MKTACHQPKTNYSHIQFSGNRKIVLVGNPNVGKSIFFGYLTKQYANVSNYPGTTIDLSTGSWGKDAIIDTPGIYSVSSLNDEEIVARDIILDADIIINIVDSVRLERDLFLTQQLIDMQKPMVVALNFMDEAEKNGLNIHADTLENILGVPVIPTTAKDGKGLRELEQAISHAKVGISHGEINNKLSELVNQTGSFPEALLILEGDEVISNRHHIQVHSEKDIIYSKRREVVNNIANQVVSVKSNKIPFSEKIGRWSLEPIRGTIFFLGVLYLLYLIVGQLIAGDLVGITEKQLMGGYYNPWIRKNVANIVLTKEQTSKILVLNEKLSQSEEEHDKFKEENNDQKALLAKSQMKEYDKQIGDFERNNPFYTILVGRFGLLTMTITYLLGLLLPLVIGFYIMFALLEDSGYLPRLATLVDQFLTKIGLNGRAVIPLILGFGCVQLGTISTRLLGTTREKQIAISLLNFTIPCSAQLGVITVMLAASSVHWYHILFYVGSIFSIFVIIGMILDRKLAGESLPLLMDLPPMRLPKFSNVLRKTMNRTYFFMKEASPWFFLGAFLVTLLQVTGGLDLWKSVWAPITESWLKLPKESATAFIMGMIRRDFGAAGLIDLALTPFQIVISLIVITLFVPCIASFMVIIKERGIKEGVLVWLGALVLSFTVGGIFSQIGSLF